MKLKFIKSKNFKKQEKCFVEIVTINYKKEL